MNTINEMCLAWYMWVNGNYDILIMTITLIVVAGLVLEVVRLKNRIKEIEKRAEWDVENLNEKLNLVEYFDGNTYEQLCEIKEKFERNIEAQVNVNVHLDEDIERIDAKLNQLKMTCDSWGIRKPSKNK